MKDRETFLASRKFDDGRFVALSNKGKLYQWDFITGKPLQSPPGALQAQSYK
jgi:hypothetical protein